MPQDTRAAELRRRVYAILEEGPIGGLANRIVTRGLIALIVVNLLAVILESVPALAHDYGGLFRAVEEVSLVVFTAEYLIRLWVAPEHEQYQHRSGDRARLAYAVSAAGLIDL